MFLRNSCAECYAGAAEAARHAHRSRVPHARRSQRAGWLRLTFRSGSYIATVVWRGWLASSLYTSARLPSSGGVAIATVA